MIIFKIKVLTGQASSQQMLASKFHTNSFLVHKIFKTYTFQAQLSSHQNTKTVIFRNILVRKIQKKYHFFRNI